MPRAPEQTEPSARTEPSMFLVTKFGKKKLTILDKQLLGYLEAAARTRRPKNSPYLTTPSKPVKLRLAAKYHTHMQVSHAHAHVTCCTCACICACACIRTNAPGHVSQARCPRVPRPTPRTPRLNAPTPTWRGPNRPHCVLLPITVWPTKLSVLPRPVLFWRVHFVPDPNQCDRCLGL